MFASKDRVYPIGGPSSLQVLCHPQNVGTGPKYKMLCFKQP
jgi:hypothetical protein